MNEIDPPEINDDIYPEWLKKEVAIPVDEWVQQPPIMHLFRQRLREWKTKHDARGPAEHVDSNRMMQYNPVKLQPRQAATLAEVYVVLAAIHDEVCPDATQINPWYVAPDDYSDPDKFPMVLAGTSYQVLCAKVEEIKDGDKEGIEGYITRAKRNIAQEGFDVTAIDTQYTQLAELSAVKPGETAVDTRSQRMSQRAQKAGASYEWACKECPDLLKEGGKYSKKIWEHIKENGCLAYKDSTTPAYDTWKRYLRECFPAENTPRRGREHGKSIVKISQL